MNNIGLRADKELQKIRDTDIGEEIDINIKMDKADTRRWKYSQIDKLLDTNAFTIRCTEEIVTNRQQKN